MNSFMTFFKIEAKLVWKSIDILIFGILFPIILGSIFGYTLSKDSAGSGASNFDLSYASVITIGILATGVMGLSLTLADYRHRGILQRLQVTPVSPSDCHCSRTCSDDRSCHFIYWRYTRLPLCVWL